MPRNSQWQQVLASVRGCSSNKPASKVTPNTTCPTSFALNQYRLLTAVLPTNTFGADHNESMSWQIKGSGAELHNMSGSAI